MLPGRVLARPWAAVLVLLAAAAALAVPPEPRLVSGAAKELWLRGSDQTLAGDFTSALTTLQQVEKMEPGDNSVVEAITWLRDVQDLAASRERLRVRNYDHYVAEALKAAKEAKEGPKEATSRPAGEDDDQERPAKGEPEASTKPARQAASAGADHEEGDGLFGAGAGDWDENDPSYKWGTALRYAQAAMANAPDEDEFRNLPWLQELVDHVRQQIEEHKTRNRWRDALALYYILKELYPETKEYADGIKFCAKRAHLDFVYGPKSTWRADLNGVTTSAVKEILTRMEADYVEEIDLQALCLNGLAQLAILGQAASLTETFPQLGDQDLADHFGTPLKVRDVQDAFNQALKANGDSLRLPEGVLVDEFVAGLLEPLDEFTAVVWPAEVAEFNKHTRGEFVGVGIQITKPEGQPVRVESPLENTPAFRAGIKPGDLITEIDGESTVEISVIQAVRMITGEPGTTVTLTIKDPLSNEARKVTLEREIIEIHTVAGNMRDERKSTGWDYMIDPEKSIGYVRVSGFMDKTVGDLKEALQQLRSEGCRGLILDLRFNPGGLLPSARDMCELFLGENDPIVKVKGRGAGQSTELRSRRHEGFGDVPMLVLVNEYSASASEIVAGALAGKRQACIVGERTFGKGSVQSLVPIADGQAYLKMTTAYYYIYDMDLPGDDPWFCLHKREGAKTWGVEPNVEIKVIPQELNKILRLRRERDVLKGRDQDEVPKEILERQPTSQPNPHLQEDENPNTDPQIVIALDLMRVKLLSRQPWVLAPRNERALTQATGRSAVSPSK
jgi:carboxyl-terminal processing protease